jgi:hypothetical protein
MQRQQLSDQFETAGREASALFAKIYLLPEIEAEQIARLRAKMKTLEVLRLKIWNQLYPTN